LTVDCDSTTSPTVVDVGRRRVVKRPVTSLLPPPTHDLSLFCTTSLQCGAATGGDGSRRRDRAPAPTGDRAVSDARRPSSRVQLTPPVECTDDDDTDDDDDVMRDVTSTCSDVTSRLCDDARSASLADDVRSSCGRVSSKSTGVAAGELYPRR